MQMVAYYICNALEMVPSPDVGGSFTSVKPVFFTN